jgi:NTP pyrophosphatase (non-canonical NTP hydrolase)
MDELIQNVISWAEDKNIDNYDNRQAQMLKVIEEVGETASAILKDNDDAVIDGIGDSLVTLIILSIQMGYHPEYCLNKAWEEIKDRKGKTINGTFIKD